jgi:two-component system phosphate regulon response regulator PhoB
MDGQRRSVLIVDDEDGIRSLVRMTLDDYDIDEAASVAEALEAASRRRFDLFLLDVMLPDGSGFELCRALKQDPRTSSVPVLILTAKAQQADLAAAEAAGADGYFTKPFSPVALIRKMEQMLGGTA